MATLLDPRFKELGFCSQGSAQTAVDRLTRECAATMQVELPARAQPQSSPRAGPSGQLEDGSLWALRTGVWVLKSRWPAQLPVLQWRFGGTVKIMTCITIYAHALLLNDNGLSRYLKEHHITRTEHPLKYWVTHKVLYPHPYKLAINFFVHTNFLCALWEDFLQGWGNRQPQTKRAEIQHSWENPVFK